MWPAIQQETNDGRRNGCDRKRRSRNLRRNDGRPTQRRKAKDAAPHSRDRRGYGRDPVGRLVLPDASRARPHRHRLCRRRVGAGPRAGLRAGQARPRRGHPRGADGGTPRLPPTTRTPDRSPHAQPNVAKRKKLLRILAIVVVTVAILWGVWYFLTQAGRVHTDNAYVGADSAQVTALVSGPVKEVRVAGTQGVKKGDILVILDDAEQRIAVADAEAALRLARQHYGQADANADAARARVAARGAEIAQAKARRVGKEGGSTCRSRWWPYH